MNINKLKKIAKLSHHFLAPKLARRDTVLMLKELPADFCVAGGKAKDWTQSVTHWGICNGEV